MPGLANVVGIENVSEAFKEKVIRIAADLDIDPNFLMAIMSFETGGSFDPAARNPSTNATGLIQFVPRTARQLGTSVAALAAMTPLRQLDFVEAYFRQFSAPLRTLEDAYMAVLFPAAIGRGSAHVIFERPSRAFRFNAGLDLNGDGRVTVGEATERVRRRFGASPSPFAVGGAAAADLPERAAELSRGIESPEVEVLQDELVSMGYLTEAEKATGPGRFGERTERALREFQRDNELSQTGVYDAGTQAAVRQLNNGVRIDSEGGVVLPMQRRLVRSRHLTQAQLNTGPGIFGPRTQAALMRFQLDRGIQPSGTLTDETYKALYRTIPAVSPNTMHGNNAAIDVVLPPGGPGYTVYTREAGGADQVGTAATIRALMDLGADWAVPPPGGGPRPLIQYGDISRRGGGPFFNARNRQTLDHAAHRRGREVDVRPMHRDGLLVPTNINAASYDRARTRELVLLARRKFPGIVILFNDTALIAEGLTRRAEGHHNHLHFQFG